MPSIIFPFFCIFLPALFFQLRQNRLILFPKRCRKIGFMPGGDGGVFLEPGARLVEGEVLGRPRVVGEVLRNAYIKGLLDRAIGVDEGYGIGPPRGWGLEVEEHPAVLQGSGRGGSRGALNRGGLTGVEVDMQVLRLPPPEDARYRVVVEAGRDGGVRRAGVVEGELLLPEALLRGGPHGARRAFAGDRLVSVDGDRGPRLPGSVLVLLGAEVDELACLDQLSVPYVEGVRLGL